MDETRADEIAADLTHRQQRIDALADPANPEKDPGARPAGARQYCAPREIAEKHRNQVKERDGQQAPADHEHGFENGGGAVISDQIGGKREPEKPGEIEGGLDGATPCPRAAGNGFQQVVSPLGAFYGAKY